MKSLNSIQLKQYWQWIFPHIEGAQLQDIWTNDRLIVMEFYKFKSFYLLFDMNPAAPQVVLLQHETNFGIKKTKPLGLFLNSHAKNRRLVEGKIDLDKGRVLLLKLAAGPEVACEVEVHLIPRSVNMIVRVGEKSISWEKPRPLPAAVNPGHQESVDADWSKHEQNWLNEFFVRHEGKASPLKSENKNEKSIEKKRKAILELQKTLASDEAQKLREYGESLKGTGKSNEMKAAFDKAKALEKKRQGTIDRLKILEEEIINLLHPQQSGAGPVAAVPLLKKSDNKFDSRKIQFSENLFALIGKSAKDNMEILRQAQPWCFWMHLRDYPSAHAVIFCQKGWRPQPDVLQKVADKLLSESISKKNKEIGVKYDVVVVECRYVRPIKGDKQGRVTYHHPVVFTFASKA